MALALPTSRARAGTLDVAPPAQEVTVERAQAGDFTLNLSAASVGSGGGVTAVLAGYDGDEASAVYEASVEAFVASRLAIRAAAAYLPSETRTSLQPQFALRWQIPAASAQRRRRLRGPAVPPRSLHRR